MKKIGCKSGYYIADDKAHIAPEKEQEVPKSFPPHIHPSLRVATGDYIVGASPDCNQDPGADRQCYNKRESCMKVPTVDTTEGKDLDDVDVDEGKDAEEGDVLRGIRHNVHARQEEHNLVGKKQKATGGKKT
jgi:hypothetical protein